MAYFTAARRDEILAWHGTVPPVAVETGTYKGQTTRLLAEVCPRVTTIELSPALFGCSNHLRELPNVSRMLGDSKFLTPQLASVIQEPVLWYLDAHWYERPAVVGRNDFPLWTELHAISGREQPDLIIVDDVHSFGTPLPEDAWVDVTEDRIAMRFNGARMKHFGDQYAISKNP